MAASLLTPLALLAMAVSAGAESAAGSAGAESAAHESDAVTLRAGCESMLTTLAETGMGETEVALECRARLPPELCHTGLAELGAMPWTEDKVNKACGEMTHDIELSIDALPRDMRDAAWNQMNDQVEKIMAAKRKLTANPIKLAGKPVFINLKGFKLELTVIVKFLETMRMTDITNKYYACQRTHCTPTTTPKPADPLGILFGALKAGSKDKKSPLYLKPLPPLKFPSKKYAEEEDGGSPQGAQSFAARAWLSFAVGGSAMVAVAAFAANRMLKSRRSLSMPDESTRTLSRGDDGAEDYE